MNKACANTASRTGSAFIDAGCAALAQGARRARPTVNGAPPLCAAIESCFTDAGPFAIALRGAHGAPSAARKSFEGYWSFDSGVEDRNRFG